MTAGAVLRKIQVVAEQHVSLPGEELERAIDRAWAEAGLIEKGPVRGERLEFLRRIRDQLVSRASSEIDSVNALTAMVAADVAKWASDYGIPAEKYEYPIGLLAAWVVVAALDKKRQDPQPPFLAPKKP